MAIPNDPLETDADEQESPRSGSRLAIWLIIFGIGLLFLPLYLVTSTIKDTSASLQTELDSVNGTLAYTPPPNPSAEALSSTLSYVGMQNDALKSLEGTLVGLHVDWPSIMVAIGSYDPAHISITAITQSGAAIVIDGQADNQASVSVYAETLRQSNLFASVDMGSITMQILPTPTPTPTPTPNPESTAEAIIQPTQMIEPQSVANFEITVSIQVKAK